MNCQESRELIDVLERGELDPAAFNELHTHLTQCENCAEEYEDVLEMIENGEFDSAGDRDEDPALAGDATFAEDSNPLLHPEADQGPLTPTRNELAAAVADVEAAIKGVAEEGYFDESLAIDDEPAGEGLFADDQSDNDDESADDDDYQDEAAYDDSYELEPDEAEELFEQEQAAYAGDKENTAVETGVTDEEAQALSPSTGQSGIAAAAAAVASSAHAAAGSDGDRDRERKKSRAALSPAIVQTRPPMSAKAKRKAFIAAAFAVAIGILAITIITGNNDNSTGRQDNPAGAGRPINPDDIFHDDPIDDPNKLARTPNDFPIGKQIDGQYTQVSEKGVITQFFWRELDPKPNGVFEVKGPGTRIHLKPGQRVVQIQATEGVLAAPNRQPRSGRFAGNVVVTLFERPENVDRAVYLANDSPDVRLRLFMSAVDFDIELGKLTSNEEIKLTGPRLNFQGKGLELDYNEADRVIENLTILKGRELRFKTVDATGGIVGGDGEAKPDEKSNDATAKATDPKDAAAEQDELQLYRAVLQDTVRIRNIDAVIEANVATVIFALGPGKRDKVFEDLTDKPASPTTSSNGNTEGEPATADPAVNQIAKTAARDINVSDEEIEALLNATRMDDAPEYESLSIVSKEDDVIINWRGPLEVIPLEGNEHNLETSDDIRIALDGAPVNIKTADGNVINAATVRYKSENGRIVMTGTDDYPLLISSPEMGVLSDVERLVIDQLAMTGVLEGGGMIKAHGEQTLLDELGERPKFNADNPSLPRGLTVSWLDRVDLTFFPKKDASGNPRDKQIGGLKSATFVEEVTILHSQLQLYTQKLAFSLDDEKDGKQFVRQVEGYGGTRVWARGRGENEELAITSTDLIMQLQAGPDGELHPKRILADGNVRAEQPGNVIRSKDLDVEFIMRKKSERILDRLKPGGEETEVAGGKPAAEQEDELVPDVHKMVANEARIDLTENNATIIAHKLVANVDEDKLELWGTDEQNARVMRPDGMLEGKYLVMSQRAESVSVPGPGVFHFNIDAAEELAAADDDDKNKQAKPKSDEPGGYYEPDPLNKVAIRWSESMLFDNLAGKATFIGDVVANARSGLDTTHMSGDRLDMRFIDVSRARAEITDLTDQHDAIGDAGGVLVNRLGAGDHQLQKVTVSGNAIFLSENWLDKPGHTLETRVRLTGPVIEFNNISERVTVLGEGKMLIQDQRPKLAGDDKNEAREDDNKSLMKGVNFTGRGVTVFEWQRTLVLDALNNDMILQQNVGMHHQPLGKQDIVRLYCEQFTADLEESGGLNSWLEQRGPHPRLVSAEAKDQVTMENSRYTIYTDRMLYTGRDETVQLFAKPGFVTQIVDQRQPAPMTAKKFKWNLRRDVIDIEEVGTGRIPIRQR